MFIGREKELAHLEKRYASLKAELFVLYGRRRVGKTALIRHFCKDKPAIYFVASQVQAGDNLGGFINSSKRFLPNYRDGIQYATLVPLLEELAQVTREQKLIIVIDEFQYWVNADPSLPSLLQNFWDAVGQQANLMIILCGSYISLMIDQVLAEKSPLYGRRTGQFLLQPFDYRAASLFFPNYSFRDKLLVYGILGGMPAYLSQFDPEVSLQENIEAQILQKGTLLNEEADFLLRTELRDSKTYASLLKAISAGNTVMKDIASKMKMDGRGVSFYLNTLQELHLVKREVAFIESAPEKSRKGRYSVQDHFLNFWFRFVEPNISLVELDEGEAVFQEIIQPQLNTYMGKVFEDICQQYVKYYGRELLLPLPIKTGRIWDRDYDLDVVTENIDGTYLFGECKWSSQPSDPALYYQLKERAGKTGLNLENAWYLLFNPSGFRGNEPVIERLKLVTEQELFING